MSRDGRVISASVHRRRRAVVWLCGFALVLLGLGAQLHGLGHALQATQGPVHQDAVAAHTQACEQCLQFAGLDGAAPNCCAAQPPVDCASNDHDAPESPLRAVAFTAYASRAPPPAG